MIRHEHCRKNLPIGEFADGRLECFERGFVRQNPSTIRDTNRHEINHVLFPWYPNGYARRMTHLCSLAGEAPALQSVSAKREWPNAYRTLSLTEAMAFPCSPAHRRPLPPHQNFPLIPSVQFCPGCRLLCGDT